MQTEFDDAVLNPTVPHVLQRGGFVLEQQPPGEKCVGNCVTITKEGWAVGGSRLGSVTHFVRMCGFLNCFF